MPRFYSFIWKSDFRSAQENVTSLSMFTPHLHFYEERRLGPRARSVGKHIPQLKFCRMHIVLACKYIYMYIVCSVLKLLAPSYISHECPIGRVMVMGAYRISATRINVD
jgi:hypothetical protein